MTNVKSCKAGVSSVRPSSFALIIQFLKLNYPILEISTPQLVNVISLQEKRPPTLTFRVATTFHDPRVINTEYPSTGPCHIGRFKNIDNVMSARPWDSVKAFAVTSIEACLSAKNEVTVERIKIHYSKKWKVRIGGIFTL